MCLAIPAKIISIENKYATADLGGVIKKISISLVPDIKPGEYVLLHAGYAIEKFKQDEALETIRLAKELAGLQDIELEKRRKDA